MCLTFASLAFGCLVTVAAGAVSSLAIIGCMVRTACGERAQGALLIAFCSALVLDGCSTVAPGRVDGVALAVGLSVDGAAATEGPDPPVAEGDKWRSPVSSLAERPLGSVIGLW